MKRACAIAMLVTAIAQSAFGQAPFVVEQLSLGGIHSWRIRWDRSDEFNKESVDWQKWQKKPEKFGGWDWDNTRNACIEDGVLTLTVQSSSVDASKKPGRKSPRNRFSAAMLKSYRTGCYGYYEARIKGAALFPGVCPAFWLYSRIDDALLEEGAVRYSEIDVVELTQRNNFISGNERITDHNLHVILSNGQPGVAGRQWLRPGNDLYRAGQANEYSAPFDPRDDFHVYGCEVTVEKIAWYVDGLKIGEKQNSYWHRDMHVALSVGLRPPYVTWTARGLVYAEGQPHEGFPAAMQVDYVRVWDRVESANN